MLTRSLLLLTSLLIATTSFSQTKTKIIHKGPHVKNERNVVSITTTKTSIYSLNQFSGKWQEVSRTDRNNNAVVPFSDTIFLSFTGDNVYTRDGMNMSLKGKASLDKNSLMAAADLYTIKSLGTNKVVLDDGDKYIHTLIKKQKFWYETLPNTAVVSEKYYLPTPINLSAIRGKWQVYRRDAQPGSLSTDDYLVKMINNISPVNGNSASGEITYYLSEKLETQPCTITIDGDKINISTANHSWTMHTYKADGNEFVFGETGLMYYSKPL